MKHGTILVAALVLLCTTGCIRLTAGVYPESYKPQFRGWVRGYASHKEMRNYDGTILELSTFCDAERPGEIVSVDLWPLAGIGVGPLGMRLRLLPFGMGFGTIAYDPRPQPELVKKTKKRVKRK